MMRARVLMALALPAMADAYTVWSSTPDASNIARWPSLFGMSPTPVAVEIHDAGTPDSPEATMAVDEIMASFANWEMVVGAQVQFAETSWSGAYFSYGSDTGNMLNKVGFVVANWPASAASALAVTIVQGGGPPGARFIEEADIYINEDLYDWSDDWSTGGQSGLFDVRSVVTHEVGHFIGLDHTPIPAATMYYAVGPGDVDPGDLHGDDAEGARFLYPSPAPHTCTTNGQCPTVQEFLDPDNTDFGTMVCEMSGICCFAGMGCVPGTGGGMGDPCYSDADCIAGFHCPYDGDTCQSCGTSTGAFPECTSTPDCPMGTGYECWLLEADDTFCGNCLPPCTFQIDCFGDEAHCLDMDSGPGTNLRCVPDEATGYYRCSRSQPSQCPTGQGCLASTIGEICSDRGTGAFGDPCANSSDCYSLLCDPTTGPGATCAQGCGTGWPDCPAGYACDWSSYFSFNVCEPFGPEPGPEPMPEPMLEPTPEPMPEPPPEPAPEPTPEPVDGGPDAPASSGDPPIELEAPLDEGCQCALGQRATARGLPWAIWLGPLGLALASLRRRNRR